MYFVCVYIVSINMYQIIHILSHSHTYHSNKQTRLERDQDAKTRARPPTATTSPPSTTTTSPPW
ncbi:hypothetical protein HanRHA438_Chr13g0595641 [Helianthus annuus]|uniref:Uncharacterized protein n=1 Tax=Helianthus annuus TaxID=4232 RepID=A0A9K3EG57_HELAN|nr:hypothetical protein HanXRQr2_Chr13g0584891 [Helianthus annuus]KAJ0480915.1 hypothetical protein HanIR_Chr13g0636951 [Helianthus annuus]KAJ0848920.1 hypothetical protein HanPSC8_Chr13g0563031 [Helianthus annuus]KAJ0857932.1 hypothetical protein HanRHA438_Chr13g0595641 [Helianthus annuus]